MDKKGSIKYLLSVVLSFILSTIMFGEVRLPSILADNMVLQRNSTVRLWGWSNASELIMITASWDGHTYDVKADRNARWEIMIPTPEAGGPYTIAFKASNELILKNILIGEVWICSGQSNMEWSAVNGYDHDEEEVANANHAKLRLFKIPNTTSRYPQDNCDGQWEICTPTSVKDFSAVAYFFGKHLQEGLDVPIGLIQAAWGGTAAEVWTPQEVIDGNPEFAKWDEVLSTSDYWPREPAVLYNAMIHPIVKFNLAGAIWYQGEANTANALVYRDLFPAMINSWRDAWDFPMPFYYVQIAPYNYGSPMQGALVRESQLKTMAKVPNTGMVVVSDIGNIYDIHPRNKIDVGTRLANWALARTYGQKDIRFSGPLYHSHRVENGTLIVSFKYAEEGLLSRDGPLKGFELAGEDQIFYPAEAVIKDKEVVVSSPYVLNPVAVRFGFGNITETNLFNQFELPASSFRTDDWPIIVKPITINIEYKNEAQAYLVSLTGEGVDQIKYTLNGDHPGLSGLTYRQPFYIDKNCTIKALAFFEGRASDALTAKEVQMNLATYKSLVLATNPDNPFYAGGKQALVDGISGGASFNDGHWQGYLGKDLSAVIDFGERVEISKISTRAFKNQDLRIFLPNKVTFEISNDGERFTEIYRKPLFHARDPIVETFDYSFVFKSSRKTRYLRISAENMGTCPDWHSQAGEKAWILLDEIVVQK
jgi:sialate O-acetylesterase